MSYFVKKIIIFIIIFGFILVTPTLAQQKKINLPDFHLHDIPVFSSFHLNEDKAPVILDGRELFKVGNFSNEVNPLTATQRARDINNKLEKAVELSTKPQIEIRKNHNLPTIFLNNNHLFTVTTKDVHKGENITQKAQEITTIIEQNITKAQQERNGSSKDKQYIIAIAMIAIALIINRLLNLLIRTPTY